MARISPNAPCPCGRPLKFKHCCERLHKGVKGEEVESVMRARYSAYAAGDVRFIQATTHPESPHYRGNALRWGEEIRRFTDATRFVGLEVRSARQEGNEGEVTFVATMEQEGRKHKSGEKSRFLKTEKGWMYHAGERVDV